MFLIIISFFPITDKHSKSLTNDLECSMFLSYLIKKLHLQVSRELYVDSLEKGLKMQLGFPKGLHWKNNINSNKAPNLTYT